MVDSDRICFVLLFIIEYGTLWVAIAYGGVLLSQTSTSCAGFRFLGMTLILIGIALMILWYVSCLLADVDRELAIAKSILCSMPLILALFGLGIFALAVSSKGEGRSLPGRSYKEYHVESYSKWMQKKVNNSHNWDVYYKKAVVKGHVCKMFSKEYQLDILDEFHQRSLNPFESGCCKPPEDCNFDYTNSTFWVKPENGNYSDDDCNRWDNDPNILCFNCQSCKAGFLQDLKSHWFTAGFALVFLAAKQILCGICIFYCVHSYD